MKNEHQKQLYDKINELIDSVNTMKSIILEQNNKIRLLELRIENIKNKL